MPTAVATRRQPKTFSAPLSLNEVIPLAQQLAQKEQHRPDDVDDLVSVALFAYHKAEQRYRKLRRPVDKPWAFAKLTMQRAMRGYYFQQREWQTRGEPNKAVGLEFAEMIPTGQQVELLELDDYFNALERKCGATARLMVEQLLMPSGECCGRILQEVRGKLDAQEQFRGRSHRARRHQPRGVKKGIRISHRIVRDALDISPTEWARNMNNIRDFTREWIGRSA